MKICVYTCITGDYDSIKEVNKINMKDKIDFICYTNNKNLKSKTWKVVYIEDKKLTNVQLARRTKILGTEELKQYDITVWMDGDIEWDTSIIDFIDKYVDLEKYDLVGFKHHRRNSVAEEILACYELGKIPSEEALKIQDFYKKTDFKDDIGLIETTLLFRNFNNSTLQKAMKKWFDFIINLTHRDQLSFNYVQYLTGLKVNLLDINIWNNEYFSHHKHSKTLNAYVYFKKNNTFDLDVKGYKCLEGSNKIDIIVNYDTDRIRVKFDSQHGVILRNVKCKQAQEIIPSGAKEICSANCLIILELCGSFKKNDRVELTFDLVLKDVFELMAQLLEQEQQISGVSKESVRELKMELIKAQEFARQCREELDNVMNSKSMKITKPLRDLTSLISRKKNKEKKLK